LGPNESLILNSNTNILLCPDDSCTFHSTSIVRIQPTVSNNEKVTVLIGKRGTQSSSSKQMYGNIEISPFCSLEVTHHGTITASNIIIKNGGTLKVVNTTTTLVAMNLEMEENSGNAGHIIVDQGGKIYSKMSAPLTISGLLEIRQATSQFNSMSDLRFTSSSIVTWECSAGDDVHLCGRILVSGTAYLSGTANITSDKVKNPIISRSDVDMATGSLISAVDRMGQFDVINLDDVFVCAGATTSWSWSAFTMRVSTRCTQICQTKSVCTVLPPSSAPKEENDDEDEDEEDEDEDEDEEGEQDEKNSGNKNGAGVFYYLSVVGVAFFVCIGVIGLVVRKIRRNNSYTRGTQLSDAEEEEGLELEASLPPYRD
jgi:hypothetical protein